MRTDQTARRPRVLHLAYACAPGYGSEPGVGWNRALQTARHCDTWVICEEGECGPPTRQYLEANGPVPGLTFAFLPLTRLQKILMQLPGLYWVAYNLWHRRAFHLAQRLHEQVRFDLVHQVNLNSFREPGYLWKLDVPFVWGPVGGTQNYPWGFLKATQFRGAVCEIIRTLVNRFQLRFSRRVRRAIGRAAFLFTANTTGQADLARVHGISSEIQCDVGINHIRARSCERPAPGTPLRILWSGELSTRKALPLLLSALARMPVDVPYELRVLGEGKLRGYWERLARKLKVDSRITWMGQLPHKEALEQFRNWADVLAFTSLRDTSGTVVLEALSAGVPVVCLDHQGMRDIVTPKCGVKISVTTPCAVITCLSESLAALACDPAERERLGRGGMERAREYLYSRQAEMTVSVYRQLLGRRDNQGQDRGLGDQPALHAEGVGLTLEGASWTTS